MISTMAKLRSASNQEKKSKTKEVCLLNTRCEQTYGFRSILRGGGGNRGESSPPPKKKNPEFPSKSEGGGSISHMNFLHELLTSFLSSTQTRKMFYCIEYNPISDF